MKMSLLGAMVLLALVAPVGAQSPQDHQQHRPGGAPATQSQPGPAQPRGQAQAGQAASAASEVTKAYTDAMDRMHGPMMQAVQDSDPDAAFVKSMIPHHQGAIDMAKIVLQHGKDAQVKKWANDVIREQQREIDEMQAWLKKRGK